MYIKPLNAELNPICNLLALLGAHHIFHFSGLRVNNIKYDYWNIYKSRFYHVMHAYTYMSARFSSSCNEVLQTINDFVINQKCHYMQWDVLSFLFSILCSGTVETGEVGPADVLGCGVSGTHFGEYYECYVSRVLRDVT